MVRTVPGFQTKPELHPAAELSLEMMVNSFGQVPLRAISLSQCLQFDLSSEFERNPHSLAFQLQRIVSELAAELRP